MSQPDATPARRVILVSVDLLASSQLHGVTQAAGLELDVLGPAGLLASAEAAPPALVIFDLTTPLDDLPGTVAALKSLTPPPAVVAFGPHVQGARLEAAADAGCDAVLTRGQFHRSSAEVLARYASAEGGGAP
ncbi:MAG: hypothetical protein AAGB00_10925 [Planctomycetota bacterium]